MQKTPSKFLSRMFLRQLQTDNHVSKGGLEYSADEVHEALIEKETRLADQEFARELKASASSSLIDMASQIREFQDTLVNLNRARGSILGEMLSRNDAVENLVSVPILNLPSFPVIAEVETHQTATHQLGERVPVPQKSGSQNHSTGKSTRSPTDSRPLDVNPHGPPSAAYKPQERPSRVKRKSQQRGPMSATRLESAERRWPRGGTMPKSLFGCQVIGALPDRTIEEINKDLADYEKWRKEFWGDLKNESKKEPSKLAFMSARKTK